MLWKQGTLRHINRTYITHLMTLILHTAMAREHPRQHLSVGMAIRISKRKHCPGRIAYMSTYLLISTRLKETTRSQDHTAAGRIREIIYTPNLRVSHHHLSPAHRLLVITNRVADRRCLDPKAIQTAQIVDGTVTAPTNLATIVRQSQTRPIMFQLSRHIRSRLETPSAKPRKLWKCLQTCVNRVIGRG